MKVIVYSLALLGFSLLFAAFARADNVVLSCASPWGVSNYCGGCTGPQWKTPAQTLKVKTDSNNYWVAFSTLSQVDIVYTNATKKDGDSAICSEATRIKIGDLEIIQTPPLPPIVLSTCLTTGCGITWTTPTLNEDGTAVKEITDYILNVNGVAQHLGNINTYSLIKPIGDYILTLQTITADGTSKPTNSIIAHVVAPTTTTPPPPKVVTVIVPGKWTLKKGSTNVQTLLPSEAACISLAESKAVTIPSRYSCNVANSVTVSKP